MDVQLQELIDKIKSEGVASAEQRSSEIVSAAEEKAQVVRRDAQKNADAIIKDAEAQADKLLSSGREALVQAGRDLLLNLQQRIQNVFETLIQAEAKEALGGDVLETAILALVQSWSGAEKGGAEIVLSEGDFSRLESTLTAKLAAQIKNGVKIRPSKNVDSGFQVSIQDGKAYYNFTASEIAEVLSDLLNVRLAEIITAAAQ